MVYFISLAFSGESIPPGFNLTTMVLLILLNILCVLLLVNIHPKITSIGRRNDFPKLSIAAYLISTLLPDKSIVFILKSLLPIDCPLVNSKSVQCSSVNRKMKN